MPALLFYKDLLHASTIQDQIVKSWLHYFSTFIFWVPLSTLSFYFRSEDECVNTLQKCIYNPSFHPKLICEYEIHAGISKLIDLKYFDHVFAILLYNIIKLVLMMPGGIYRKYLTKNGKYWTFFSLLCGSAYKTQMKNGIWRLYLHIGL